MGVSYNCNLQLDSFCFDIMGDNVFSIDCITNSEGGAVVV